jgi:hypothetical protein
MYGCTHTYPKSTSTFYILSTCFQQPSQNSGFGMPSLCDTILFIQLAFKSLAFIG